MRGFESAVGGRLGDLAALLSGNLAESAALIGELDPKVLADITGDIHRLRTCEVPIEIVEGIELRVEAILGILCTFAAAVDSPKDDEVVTLATRVLFDSGLLSVFSQLIVKLKRQRELLRPEDIEASASGDLTRCVEAAGVQWRHALHLIQVVVALLGAGTDR